MHVWLIHQHAGLPDTAGGYVRHYALARELAQSGHDITIIASSFDHKSKIDKLTGDCGDYRIDLVDGIRFCWLKSWSYRGNDLRRVLNLAQFPVRVLTTKMLVQLSEPDIILGSSPSPLAAAAALVTARRRQVPFLLEIRDLYPDTLVHLGGLGRNHPLVLGLRGLERMLYRQADAIISTLPNITAHVSLVAGKAKSVVWLPNGVVLGKDQPSPKLTSSDEFLVMYSGGHGLSNYLDPILDAAELVGERAEGRRIRFEFIGDGPRKPALVERVERSTSLRRRVRFTPPVPQREVVRNLARADCLIASVSPSPLYQAGISLNKIGDYLAAARPIVLYASAQNNFVVEADAGIRVDPVGGPSALADALVALCGLEPCKRRDMGRRGYEFAQASLGYAMLAKRLAGVFTDTLHRSQRARLVAPTQEETICAKLRKW